MVKKKVSAQTIAIIILAILLILSICFGGVYAFYSSKSTKITGRILMASLKINLVSEVEENNVKSERSEIIIANSTNIIPNQALENSPLIIKNTSSVDVYLLVVYELNASKIDDTTIKVVDNKTKPVIDIGTNYINDSVSGYDIERFQEWTEWTDYVWSSTDQNGDKKTYRCLISAERYEADGGSRRIEVIPENKLKLSKEMGNEYQSTSISFTFQAFAIGCSTVDSNFEDSQTVGKIEKCRKIVEMIYAAEGEHFFETVS